MDPTAGLNGGRSPSPRPAPRAETLDVRTRDGWSLRADVYAPPDGVEPAGIAVLAHALMARRSEFDRPAGEGLAAFLASSGWSAVTFDFRGHGDSVRHDAESSAASSPGQRDAASRPWRGVTSRSWKRDMPAVRYDDLVTIDLPAVCDFARWQARGKPLAVVGHSLGGHVALAALGSGAVDADMVVGIGATIWLPELEPSLRRWIAKRAMLAGAVAVARRAGRFPSRALRMGSDDEATEHMEDIERFARTGKWRSASGDVDYLESLGRVRAPVLEVVSDGDRFECPPECGRRFVARCGGPRDVIHVTAGEDGGPPPSHMGLVTSGRVRGLWKQIVEWMSATAARPQAR